MTSRELRPYLFTNPPSEVVYPLIVAELQRLRDKVRMASNEELTSTPGEKIADDIISATVFFQEILRANKQEAILNVLDLAMTLVRDHSNLEDWCELQRRIDAIGH